MRKEGLKRVEQAWKVYIQAAAIGLLIIGTLVAAGVLSEFGNFGFFMLGAGIVFILLPRLPSAKTWKVFILRCFAMGFVFLSIAMSVFGFWNGAYLVLILGIAILFFSIPYSRD